MSFANKPNFIKQAFASNGTKNNIPDTTLSEGFASFEKGFPDITMQPKESGGLPPRGQDMNGILNNGGSQFDIYQQMGGTYSLNTDILANGGYAKNSVVYEDDGVYRSLVDNNSDNFKTNPSVIGSTWQLIIDYSTSQGSNGVVGQLSFFARTDVPVGWLRCDGTQYTRSAFPQLFDDYLVAGKLPTCTYAEYNLEISDHGSCGKFALDEVNQLFKVPTLLNNVFISQALTEEGEFTEAGLPNITGVAQPMANNGQAEGAFNVEAGQGMTGVNFATTATRFTFDASRSSPIYGNSETVTPNNIKYPFLICVANLQVPVSEAQYQGFLDNISLKLETDVSNITESGKTTLRSFLTALPTSQLGAIGEFKAIPRNPALNPATWTLPDGGTWAYYYPGRYFYEGGSYGLNGVCGIAAGGTTITTIGGAASPDPNNEKMLVWRIQ